MDCELGLEIEVESAGSFRRGDVLVFVERGIPKRFNVHRSGHMIALSPIVIKHVLDIYFESRTKRLKMAISHFKSMHVYLSSCNVLHCILCSGHRDLLGAALLSSYQE